MKAGILTSEGGATVGGLMAIYEVLSAVVEKPDVSIGLGIAVGGGLAGLAFLVSKYALVRTEAKKEAGQ